MKGSKPPARAVDVARYLVELATAEEEPDYLTHLRLQKLLYYVQGWSLALRDGPMFKDRIEAWSRGPVVPSVYAVLRECSDSPIKPQTFPGTRQPLSAGDEEFTRRVWETYRDYSATSLRRMTHEEAPWLGAWGDRGPGESSKDEISHEDLVEYFRSIGE